MSKSVYSLVLSDEVIEAVDQAAYKSGTSRSNLINQILAEHLSLLTPEKRMKNVFSALSELMSQTYRIEAMPSDSMLQIRSSLRYKYNPTIRYSLELYPNPQYSFGKLKVQFRTQNAVLIDALDEFFRYYIELERQALTGSFEGDITYEVVPGRFNRDLMLPAGKKTLTDQNLGNVLAGYISNLDTMIKTYFSEFDDPEKSAADLQQIYHNYLRRERVRI